MRTRIVIFLLVLIPAASAAQVVTSDPAFLSRLDSALTVYFDATQGNGGLEGYTGDVYAHTGVLTTKSKASSEWKYVKTGWGENSSATKLTRISDDYYKLEITPSVREYYGFSNSDTITHLAFVFRSGTQKPGGGYYEGKDAGGEDIFIEVSGSGLSLRIEFPTNAGELVELNDSIILSAVASSADSIALSINGIPALTTTSDRIRYNSVAEAYEDILILVKAYGNGEILFDSVNFHVRRPVESAELPAGMTDGINYTSDTSVTLVLFAPYKNHVFLIGDMTSWFPGESGYMKQTPDQERYWIEIGKLEAGKEYRYQYLINGDLRIADYYAEKVLDRYNDPYIPESVYPDLIEYPVGLTSEIVSVLQPGGEEYQWNTKKYQRPEKSRLVIYELLVRDFIADHDFKTLTDTLDYLDRLGINAIEVMPFNEFEGNSSWGYNPSFYFAPDKYYGPADRLRAFVDSCHSRGIAVIMDIVLNHSYGQNPMVRLYFNPATGTPTPPNPWFNPASPNPVYSWGYDFNHESQHTENFVDRVTRYWMKEYKIDGFRFDFTKGFTNTPGDGGGYDAARINILSRISGSMRAFDPNAILILEHFAPDNEERELANYQMLLWGNMNHDYAEAAMGYSSNLARATARTRGFTLPHLVAYMESHDEERILYKVKNWGASSGDYDTKDFETRIERMGLVTAFFLTLPGPKMIWQFGELGYSINIDYNGRTGEKPILWDLQNDRRRQWLYQITSTLNRLRKEHEVFHTTDYDFNLSSYQKRINLDHPDMNVTVIGNFATSEAVIDPDFQSTGTWYDYFTGIDLEISDVNQQITLKPGEWRLYTDKQLEDPEIITAVENAELIRQSEYHRNSVSVFPNPSSDAFNFVHAGDHTIHIEILDLSGRMIRGLTDDGPVLWDGRDDNGRMVADGVYFARIRTAERTESLRLLKE